MLAIGRANRADSFAGQQYFTARLPRPTIKHQKHKWSLHAEGDEKTNVDKEINELKQSLSGSQPQPQKLPGEGKGKEEGKGLAIVTGAISVAIGVIYLLGVSWLNNSRGNILQPPPPEAFGWLGSHLWL